MDTERTTRLRMEPLEPRLVLDGAAIIIAFMAIDDSTPDDDARRLVLGSALFDTLVDAENAK